MKSISFLSNFSKNGCALKVPRLLVKLSGSRPFFRPCSLVAKYPIRACIMNGNKIGYKEQNYGDSQGLAGNHNWSEQEPEKSRNTLAVFGYVISICHCLLSRISAQLQVCT